MAAKLRNYSLYSSKQYKRELRKFPQQRNKNIQGCKSWMWR